MAKKKKETKEEKIKRHEKAIVEIIEKHKITAIYHVFGRYHDLCSATFYNLGLEKLESIKDAIRKNKALGCSVLINKWINSDNATLQIAAFKIMAPDEDRKKLSHQYIEQQTTNVTEPPLFPDTTEDK